MGGRVARGRRLASRIAGTYHGNDGSKHTTSSPGSTSACVRVAGRQTGKRIGLALFYPEKKQEGVMEEEEEEEKEEEEKEEKEEECWGHGIDESHGRGAPSE